MIKDQCMNDKEYMQDSLDSQKRITSTYNTFTNECEHQNLRNDFMNILKEEHNIQNEIYNQMMQRGWYQVPAAEQTKIDEAKQKFSNM
jgi:spore coat protein CotF